MFEQIEKFISKKNLVNLLILAILILAIPITIQLVRQQQILSSKAAAGEVKFLNRAEGALNDCITIRDGKRVAVCPNVYVKITAPTGSDIRTQTASLPQPEMVSKAYAQSDPCEEGYPQQCDVPLPKVGETIPGQQWCSPGVDLGNGVCGYNDSLAGQVTCSKCEPVEVPAGSACWVGGGYIDQASADNGCTESKKHPSTCKREVGSDTYPDGCTKQPAPGGPTGIPVGQGGCCSTDAHCNADNKQFVDNKSTKGWTCTDTNPSCQGGKACKEPSGGVKRGPGEDCTVDRDCQSNNCPSNPSNPSFHKCLQLQSAPPNPPTSPPSSRKKKDGENCNVDSDCDSNNCGVRTSDSSIQKPSFLGSVMSYLIPTAHAGLMCNGVWREDLSDTPEQRARCEGGGGSTPSTSECSCGGNEQNACTGSCKDRIGNCREGLFLQADGKCRASQAGGTNSQCRSGDSCKVCGSDRDCPGGEKCAGPDDANGHGRCIKTAGAQQKVCLPRGGSPGGPGGPSAPPSAAPSASPSAPVLTITKYRKAETPTDLNNATFIDYPTGGTVIPFTFSNTTLEDKFIFVQFKDNQGGVTNLYSDKVQYVGPNPEIRGSACAINQDLKDGSLLFRVRGTNFGERRGGSLKADNSELEVESWSDTFALGRMPNPPDTTRGKKYTVTLKRADGVQTDAECKVDTTQIAVGAKLFCRTQNNFDQDNVDMSIFATQGVGLTNPQFSVLSKTSEKVTIGKDGLIQNMKTVLQEGAEYILCLKAPLSLRTCTDRFIATSGTNLIKDFSLPVGDLNADSCINSVDAGSLRQQWGASRSNPNKNCDFNKDGQCNSFEWGCMLRDFSKCSTEEPK